MDAVRRRHLPYKNTFNISSMLAQRTFRNCQVTADITRLRCAGCVRQKCFYMVGAQGLEPWTLGLKVRCSEPTELYSPKPLSETHSLRQGDFHRAG